MKGVSVMKMLEKLTNRMAKTASSAVKEEVQGAAIDILPTLLGIGGMIFGAVLFKKHDNAMSGNMPKIPGLPSCSTITITTNNYYFGENFVKNEEEANS